ncbi:hypothetical protein [Beijerinckia indica]|uniref:Uncharacterized protein n=1 Tax=Beijerinckia indica subsp. indica (strain ATCC 9039 / DSM 1715 / NCIMB 8712) TaxID=395963 RepID=B2IB03_BEII9|nr:hypothetical protein [Beijerinckia indica]ACB93703.1 hypothetical protein Bind_0044 [Beijerinckia indica subsp. indica ATCC 9039]
MLTPILVGPLSRYGAVPADTVADAIVTLIGQAAPGCNVHENNNLRRLAAPAR